MSHHFMFEKSFQLCGLTLSGWCSEKYKFPSFMAKMDFRMCWFGKDIGVSQWMPN